MSSVPAGVILGATYARRFSVLSGGRPRGTEDVGSHFRKGAPGDWTNYFTPLHIEAFDDLYGDLVGKLGYDTAGDGVRFGNPPASAV